VAAPAFPGGAEIPFSRPDIVEADIDAVTSVLRGGWLTSGAQAEALEQELGERLGGVHVVATSSCTAALEIAAAHLRLPPGSRVGVTTWTYAASAFACQRWGLVPVLLDIDPGTLNVSAESLDAAASSAAGLAAAVLVHVGGVAVAKDVHDACLAHDLPVIEDQAHALGARDHRGVLAGRGTRGAGLSFYATKNLPAGEGGALVTDDADIAAFARTFRQHGVTRTAWDRRRPGDRQHYDVVEPGIKGNLPDVLAALARTQLIRFDEHQARRSAIARRYRAKLAGAAVDLIPTEVADDHAHHLVVVRLPVTADRAAVRAALADAGIGTAVHYPPLHRLSWFRANAPVGPTGVGNAEVLADHVLSLPIYPGLDDAAVDRVCGVLADAVRT
jgi:dTDP-4-amino-4,6-dideoxygalactose transaminase